jgi:hypothetical protein
MKKIATLGTVSTVVALLLIGCGSSSNSDDSNTSSANLGNTLENNPTNNEMKTGYFIDSPVMGAEYKTSSGQSGTTDFHGRFQFKDGDSVEFSIGKLSLGEATPDSDGLVTPNSLSNGDEAIKIRILRVLQALDEDDNPSNGITIPSEVSESLSSLDQEVSIANLKSDADILALDNSLAQELDEDYDGTIDVSADIAEQHYNQSLTAWENREPNDEQEGHAEENGNSERGHNGTLDIESSPLSTLTQDLKDAISYMGNEERLAHDVYTNLYNYHSENSAVNINQLKNIADRSETQHVQTIQAIVRKYNLSEDNLTNVTNPVASSSTPFENLPIGVYDIPAIQSLYDALYAKGIQSQKDALEVGCMVEVTDINDLNDRIVIAQSSNATDIVDAFTSLRDASYNHYWAFDKGLENIGIENGCCSLGTIDGVNYCHVEYPKNEHDSSEGNEQGQGNGQGANQGNSQGQGHGRN